MIKVENLSKDFGVTRAVDNISFEIGKGEVVGLLGPNGAGKTTTMRLITNYLMPDTGNIRIAGINVEENPLAARQQIGYLPESAPLYHDLNVLEYLEYAASIRRIPQDQRRPRIREMVKSCGLVEVIRRNVGELSKGYRQRVGLAQTMIHNPDILILDEPTSGLDPNQIAEIRALIQDIGREKTIIISTHILPEVQATCGRVMIINKGRIVADDTVESLSDKAEGEIRCYIKARGEEETVRTALEGAPFISGFEKRDTGNGGLGYLVKGMAKETDLGEALFKLAVDKGFVLTEIRKERVSLEDVFASLTLGEDVA